MTTTTPERVLCTEPGCTNPVKDATRAQFGWNKRCEDHVRAAHAAGQARRASGDRPPSRTRKRERVREEKDTAPKGKRPGPLAGRIESALTTLGTGVFILNADDGRIVIAGSHNLAVALDGLAKENPKVRAVLERALAGGAWGAVIMATAAIVVPILANHGVVQPIPFVPQPTPSPAPDTSPRQNGDTPTHDAATGYAAVPGT